jgi:hypothetical protein
MTGAAIEVPLSERYRKPSIVLGICVLADVGETDVTTECFAGDVSVEVGARRVQ